MTFSILIQKIRETEEFAQYQFQDQLQESETTFGILQLNKETGEVLLLKPLDADIKGSYFQRAARKIYTHWRNGEIPSLTCWVS
jgi:hypothetical protein